MGVEYQSNLAYGFEVNEAIVRQALQAKRLGDSEDLEEWAMNELLELLLKEYDNVQYLTAGNAYSGDVIFFITASFTTREIANGYVDESSIADFTSLDPLLEEVRHDLAISPETPNRVYCSMYIF